MDSYFNSVKGTTKEEKAFLIAYDMMRREIEDEEQVTDILSSHVWNMLEAMEIIGVKNMVALIMISHVTMSLALKKFNIEDKEMKEAVCDSIKKMALFTNELD